MGTTIPPIFFNGDDWGMVQYGIVLPPFMLRIWPPRTFPVDVAAATKKINGTRPGKHTKSYGKSPLSMGKFTISMVIFHSYVKLPEGKQNDQPNPPESATRGRGSESGTPFFCVHMISQEGTESSSQPSSVPIRLSQIGPLSTAPTTSDWGW